MGDDLITEMLERTQWLLSEALQECNKRGFAKAEAERVYRVALKEEILRLRTEGYPATAIPDLARGNEEVAEKKVALDCAETVYDSAREMVNICKKAIDVYREQINRDWRSA